MTASTFAAGAATRQLATVPRDLTDMARGAALLGTGGGGDPYIGRLLAEQALARHGEVSLVTLAELPDDAVVLPVAMMGAPTVIVEKLAGVGQFAQAVRALAQYLNVTPTHIACMEVGGVNSMIPIAAAAELGLPLVDGDGMGRAFPELQMVLPTLSGIRATPMSIVDEKGNSGVFDAASNAWAERLARPVTVEMGCSAIISVYAMSGAEARESFVPSTLSLCQSVGEAAARARSQSSDPVATVAELLGGRVVGAGKIVDVSRRTEGGFARGLATVAASGGGSDFGAASAAGADDLTLHFQNEHLMVERGVRVEATTPDLIMVVDAETAEPITTETLRYGMRVAVLAAPCDARWHSEAGLDLVGPRYFGYDTEVVRWSGSGS
ncbi:DUF917 domain-containing protein [Micrococcales bacterium 31B]|nr:DUF917 domain-containing protein [Micrococcales bacterium 31B]